MATGNNKIVKNINDCQLIFYLDNNIFSYSIFNKNTRCFEKLKSYQIENTVSDLSETIKKIIDTNNELQNDWPIKLGCVNVTHSTLIPKVLFDKKSVGQYINLSAPENKQEVIKYNEQVFLDCYSVYTINENLLFLLKEKFNNLKIKSSASLLLDYALYLSQKSLNYLLLEVSKNYFHIIYIQNKSLEFYNKFIFNNPNDFLYYFMNCVRELKIDTKFIKAHVISDLDLQNKLFIALKKYIGISFINRPSVFSYRDKISESPNHKNHNLFGQIICE